MILAKKIFTLLAIILLSILNVPGKSKKPNIIYILADDLGYADISCYGQEKFQTPHIDQLAKEGMCFMQHYSGSTVCAPSRSSLLTGQHTGHTPIRGNKPFEPEGQFSMKASTITIAEVLKEEGYTSGAFGKWGLGFVGQPGDPIEQGFDEFYGYNCQRIAHKYYPTHLWHNNKKITLEGNELKNTAFYAQDIIHNEAVQFIEDNKDAPFFLYIPYLIPHAELIVPMDSLYKKYEDKWEEKPFINPKGDYGNPEVKLEKYCSVEKPRATFAAMVNRLDNYVGEVVAKVEELGLTDNTIIMFASDNGPHDSGGADPEFFNSNGPFRGIKRDLYEGGIRTAFIVKWPGTVEANTSSNHVSAFWDVLPTLADIAHANVPVQVNGISFLPTLKGNTHKQQQHEYLYWEFHEKGGSQAIRMGNWKAVKLKVKKKPDVAIELYDLEKDPGETKDVAEENPDLVGRMKEIFNEARIETNDFPFITTK